MKFRMLYILPYSEGVMKTVDEVVEFSEDIDFEHLQDFYKIFDYNCSKTGLVQLCCMIPILSETEYSAEIFVTRDFQVFKNLDIRKWLSSIFLDRMPIYKNGVFQRLKKI